MLTTFLVVICSSEVRKNLWDRIPQQTHWNLMLNEQWCLNTCDYNDLMSRSRKIVLVQLDSFLRATPIVYTWGLHEWSMGNNAYNLLTEKLPLCTAHSHLVIWIASGGQRPGLLRPTTHFSFPILCIRSMPYTKYKASFSFRNTYMLVQNISKCQALAQMIRGN